MHTAAGIDRDRQPVVPSGVYAVTTSHERFVEAPSLGESYLTRRSFAF